MSKLVTRAAALHPHVAMRALPAAVRALVSYDAASLWELDTAILPRALRRYRREVRAFAQEVLAPVALDLDRRHDEASVRTVMVEAGRRGLLTDLLPRPWGSAPWTRLVHPVTLVYSLKVEELCAADAGLGLAIGAHALGQMPVVLSGELSALRRFLVPAYARTRAGDPSLFAFAITEPAGGSDVEDTEGAAAYRPGTVATRAAGGWRLNGRKVFISGGDHAAHVTVFAALEGEGLESWTCFVVDRGMTGFTAVRNELKMGQCASSATELCFDDVFVPDDHVVGGLRRGWALNRATLNTSRGPVGAIALGIARGALEAALAFAGRARLGGKPLVEYQEVQLALADMLVQTAAMRALVWQHGRRWTPRQAHAAMTKVFCSDQAVRVCERAMDLLGNHGVVHGNRVEKAFRDARLTQIYEGTNQINRLALIEDQWSSLSRAAPEV